MAFLTETSSTKDLIVSSVALNSILSIDEMICMSFTTHLTSSLCKRPQPFLIADHTDEESMSNNANVQVSRLSKFGHTFVLGELVMKLPWRSMATVCITELFMHFYYWRSRGPLGSIHCQPDVHL